MEAMCYGSQVGAAQGDTHHPEMIRCEHLLVTFNQPFGPLGVNESMLITTTRGHSHCEATGQMMFPCSGQDVDEC